MPAFKGDENQIEPALKITRQGQLLSEQIGTAYRWKGHLYTCQDFLFLLYAMNIILVKFMEFHYHVYNHFTLVTDHAAIFKPKHQISEVSVMFL